ncbi:MAG: tRNA lysidine(34) synthetase TilS [Ruminococcus sp.]|nr:tRNA lysidine(34) synthetase TilS [Ruminococcus sp.]
MKHICSLMRNAIDTYNMIEENDRIAVGVSGGKDSLVLLYGLHLLSKYYPKKFSIVAVTLDPCFENKNSDFSAIEEFCAGNNIEYHIKRTGLYNVVFVDREEKNPCSLCARMRRGILHDMAKLYSCNKIALGHHKDDAVETFMMNLLQGGTIGCFSPVTYLSNKDITMIRPLIALDESDVENACKRNNLPVTKSNCPVDKETVREETKILIKNLERDYPALKNKIIHAMKKDNISKW